MIRISSIEGSVESDLLALRTFIAEAMRQVAFYVPDSNLQYDIRLIIDELLLNGADHGNAWDSNKRVHLKIDIRPDVMRIMVRDEGEGFQHLPSAYRCESTRCGGRGLYLVESICQSVRYEGNTIHCYMNIS